MLLCPVFPLIFLYMAVVFLLLLCLWGRGGIDNSSNSPGSILMSLSIAVRFNSYLFWNILGGRIPEIVLRTLQALFYLILITPCELGPCYPIFHFLCIHSHKAE